MSVCVVLVARSSARVLHETLENLHRVLDVGADQICVINNGLRSNGFNGFCTQWPQVTLLENVRDVGFSCAFNQGARATSADYILLLNPELRIGRTALQALIREMERDPLVAIVAPRVLSLDGPENHKTAGQRFSLRSAVRFLARNRWDYVDSHSIRAVGWVSSAVMLMRRSAFEQVGMLDETVLSYMDDVDLCHRLTVAGHRVLFVGTVCAHSAVAINSRHDAKVSPQAMRSLLDWYRRTHGPIAGCAFRFLVGTSFAIRMCAYGILGLMQPKARLAADTHFMSLTHTMKGAAR